MIDPQNVGRRTRAVLAGLLLSSGFIGSVRADSEEVDDNEFREDVLLCEEAVAHALECCPGLSAPDNACHFHRMDSEDSCGCSGGTAGRAHAYSDPVLEIEESERIAEASCSALQHDGECGEIAKMLARPHTDVGSSPRKCL
jgi:hypothetical protein